MKKNKNTLVWQIIPPLTEGGCLPSFIIGTMHVRDARAFHYENIFYEKILACESFATEFNLDEAVDFQMLLPESVQLSDLFSQKTFDKIDHVVKKQTGISLSHFY